MAQSIQGNAQAIDFETYEVIPSPGADKQIALFQVTISVRYHRTDNNIVLKNGEESIWDARGDRDSYELNFGGYLLDVNGNLELVTSGIQQPPHVTVTATGEIRNV